MAIRAAVRAVIGDNRAHTFVTNQLGKKSADATCGRARFVRTFPIDPTESASARDFNVRNSDRACTTAMEK